MFTVGCTGMFSNQTTYITGAGSGPYSLAIDDVNADNKTDIVIANNGGNTAGVLLNGGNGTFLTQTTYTTGGGSAPRGVVTGDVNGDNKPDIITANNGGSSVSVLLNGGNGTFLNQITYMTGTGSGPTSVALADLSGDNKSDIVVANSGTNNVGVLLNTGNGTFLNQTTYTTGAGSTPRVVTTADVNGDNKLDIVVANSGTNNVGVLLNAGNGTFLNQTTYSPGATSGPRGVAVGDVNGDGQPDIVTANTGSNNVGVLLNAGNGTFLNVVTYTAGSTSAPRGVTIADVNGDGRPDIIAANSGSFTVGVFLNVGNGIFLNATNYVTGTGSNPFAVIVADFNGDNKSDIAVANNGGNTVGVFLHC